ncbi:MAG: NAD-dependent epimerase [Bacteroidia bacterium]|nr:MAG: NAD-dependent epimerase [Bacteroidia bacterium]
MKTVLITGGTGLVGTHLTNYLISKGFRIHCLSRKRLISDKKELKYFYWNISELEIDLNAFENVEYVVHLAGENIAGQKWYEHYKLMLDHSRTMSTYWIIHNILKHKVPIKKFIGASAVGFYGMQRSDKVFTEQDFGNNDFLSRLCEKWEASYFPLFDNDINTAIIRIGLVLSKEGGLYAKLKPIFKWGLGCALGSGKQNMPWIHIEDLCRMIEFLMEHPEYTGIYNAVSDEQVNNYEFSKQLAKSLNAPFFLPNIPEWVLKLMLGEMHKMLVTGVKVSNEKIKSKGFQFKFSKLEEALKDLNQ